jgi:nitroreductase
MADFMELVRTRRSVRKFTEEEVTTEQLNHVLEAARWTPSWANTQCWEIITVTRQDLKESLQQTLVKGNPASKALTQAPVVLALCGRLKTAGYYKGEVTTKFGDWLLYDLGLVSQTICLAAHSLGLGSVIVGLFDHDGAARVLEVPEGNELVALIPLGHPDQEPKTPERRNIEDFTHSETW